MGDLNQEDNKCKSYTVCVRVEIIKVTFTEKCWIICFKWKKKLETPDVDVSLELWIWKRCKCHRHEPVLKINLIIIIFIYIVDIFNINLYNFY